jgi:hypothetical protein
MVRPLRLAAFFVGVRVTRLSIRTVGFARTVSLFGSLPRLLAQQHDGRKSAASWAADVDRVSGRPYGGTCLDRSVFLWLVMRLHGIDGAIRIGLTRSDGPLEGHAWVELDGSVVNDAADVAERYAVFDEDPVGIAFQ